MAEGKARQQHELVKAETEFGHLRGEGGGVLNRETLNNGNQYHQISQPNN